MKLGIIGGSGFVGSSIFKFVNHHETFNLDKRPSPDPHINSEIADVRDKDSILRFVTGKDAIILLAAEHRDDVFPVSLYYDVNVLGTKNVLDAMDAANVKTLIFTSSVAIYGSNNTRPKESDVPNPSNHYGRSKLAAEHLILEWYKYNSTGKSITILRPSVIFGENNRGNVFRLMNQVVSKKFVLIGSGQNKKSMAYVENVSAFIMKNLINQKKGIHIYNYSDSPDLTMLEFINKIKKISGAHYRTLKIPFFIGLCFGYLFDLIGILIRKRMIISSTRIKKFCANTQFNSEKALKHFNPPFTLEQGLLRTIKHEFLRDSKKF